MTNEPVHAPKSIEMDIFPSCMAAFPSSDMLAVRVLGSVGDVDVWRGGRCTGLGCSGMRGGDANPFAALYTAFDINGILDMPEPPIVGDSDGCTLVCGGGDGEPASGPHGAWPGMCAFKDGEWIGAGGAGPVGVSRGGFS